MWLKTVLFSVAVLSAATMTEGHKWSGNPWWNSYWWQRILCSSSFPWPWLDNIKSTYSSERISEMRTIVGQCRVDVGRCPVGSCTTKPYSFCPHDGYICPETETREVDCGFGVVQKYEYVKRCVCCRDTGIIVKGVVLDADTNTPLENICITYRKRCLTKTNEDGMFELTIASKTRSIVLRATDQNNNYLDAVRTVDVPKGVRGPIEVKLFMIKKANPVSVDSKVDTVLSLSDSPLDASSGNTIIEIPANSFIDSRRRRYNGPVNASVTFIDTPSASDDITPGRFLTPVGNTVEPLITDGIVSFNFKTPDGRSLTLSRTVTVKAREGMKVWILNENTGLWELASKPRRRGKRQVSIDEILRIQSDRWYNIDKIPGAPRCYFKGRIFNETSGDEITNSNTTSFRPQITAYTNLGQRLRLYAGYTSTPNETCYEVRCPVVSNPNNSLAGFINMSSTEMISVGGIELPHITYLTPRELTNYGASIQTAHSNIQFTIAPNYLDVFVNFVSSISGPFYINRNACESSTVSEPAFHFFKPEPPSYLPVPNNTEICTARIVFRDTWSFYNYTANSTNLPNVTGISVWEQDGSDYFYTDVAQMTNVSGGNESFISVCLKYRCSQENESTTVLLDIDIPTVNFTYNYTSPNGSVVNYTYSMQEFYCYGERVGGSVFDSASENKGTTTIEGSFIAPENVGSGPDFYDTETNDCKQEPELESFAYEFSCRGNRKGGDVFK